MEHYPQAPLRRHLSILRAPRFEFSKRPLIKDPQIKSPSAPQVPTPTENLTESMLDPFTTVGEAIVDSHMKHQKKSSMNRK